MTMKTFSYMGITWRIAAICGGSPYKWAWLVNVKNTDDQRRLPICVDVVRDFIKDESYKGTI